MIDLLVGFLIEDGDAQVHEGHGEVDALLSLVGDGDVSHHQVRLLVQQLTSTQVFTLLCQTAKCTSPRERKC